MSSSTALEIILYKHVSYLAMFELGLDQMEMPHQLSKAPPRKCFQTVLLESSMNLQLPLCFMYVYIYIIRKSCDSSYAIYI